MGPPPTGNGLAESMTPGNERICRGHFLQAADGIAAGTRETYPGCHAQPDTPPCVYFYRICQCNDQRWMGLVGTRISVPDLDIPGHHARMIAPNFTYP